MSPRRGQAATGEIKRTAGGWAIRYRESRGRRRQRGGFRTKSEAKTALDDELRKARLGPLYRPDVTVRELVDAFLEQYQGAPASKNWLRYYLIKSTDAFGDEPIGSLGALEIARWRAKLPETMRHGAHRALRQLLAAAVRCIYDMRHTFATWSLAAGISIFTLARRMGTSVQGSTRPTGTSPATLTSTIASCSTPTMRAVGTLWARTQPI